MDGVFTNKVASSGLITLNLEDYYPSCDRKVIDIKDVLYMGRVLKEKDFREWAKNHDWEQYKEASVAITCSVDAIIPFWAYMIIVSNLSGIAIHAVFGDLNTLDAVLWHNALASLDIESYRNERVVVKGCGVMPVSAAAYAEITRLLVGVTKSIMYGEPCSTVPVYKSKNKDPLKNCN
ncbi:MAG: hypothetical protein CK532_04055 [Flavobacteriales bacterium]|nr:DUF2480 family protein [Flavobacteriaceae bacterium]PHX92271.1 MAG: hypothetical protein CK532_04055 [Flavobacteriales bacterium]